MLINEKLRREIGREAVRFCRRCPAVEERAEGDRVTYSCHTRECRLWHFLSLLGLRPDMNFDVPTAEEALAEAHAHEVRRFRGHLPILGPAHDWQADARFHGLDLGETPGEEDTTFHREGTRCRS
jgi:hypothetical protein